MVPLRLKSWILPPCWDLGFRVNQPLHESPLVQYTLPSIPPHIAQQLCDAQTLFSQTKNPILI